MCCFGWPEMLSAHQLEPSRRLQLGSSSSPSEPFVYFRCNVHRVDRTCYLFRVCLPRCIYLPFVAPYKHKTKTERSQLP